MAKKTPTAVRSSAENPLGIVFQSWLSAAFGLGAAVLSGDDPETLTGTQASRPMPSLRATLAAVGVAVAAGVILSVVACDDLPTTTVVRRAEDPWAVAQGAGMLPLIVRGRPAFASDEAVNDAVFRGATQAITWTATPPLVQATPGDALAAMRLVYVFNGDAGDACAIAPAGGEPLPKGRVTLVAALCDGAQFVARVDGRIGRSEGLEDHRLRRLIRQATRDLLAPPPAPRP